jgi:hypothetical protein
MIGKLGKVSRSIKAQVYLTPTSVVDDNVVLTQMWVLFAHYQGCEHVPSVTALPFSGVVCVSGKLYSYIGG